MRQIQSVKVLALTPQSGIRELRPNHEARHIIGDSAAIRAVLRQVEQLRSSDIAVCVLGESGVGKELIARAIHSSSRRSEGPFIAINCAAVPENLQESELFGHERGAFTGAFETHRGSFEQARGGSLFLDEVGEMPAAMQAKLLRVLQERAFRRVGGRHELPLEARILSSTNRNLDVEVRAGRFRADLFFRLVAFPIVVPPLRERRGDIVLIAEHILRRADRESGGREVHISPEALDRLMNHDWPGNVRELENVVHRALLSSRDGNVGLADLPAEAFARGTQSRVQDAREPSSNELPVLPLRELERLAIEQALRRSGGNIEAAARQLGIGRATIHRRLARGVPRLVTANLKSQI